MAARVRPTFGIDGRAKRLKDIRDEPVEYVVEDAVAVQQGREKWLCLQRIRHTIPRRRLEYRFAYYMLGVKPGAAGRWVFGQYAMMVPPSHLKRLLAMASRQWPDFRALMHSATA